MSEPLATPVLRMERTFDAPVERVFRAWSDTFDTLAQHLRGKG